VVLLALVQVVRDGLSAGRGGHRGAHRQHRHVHSPCTQEQNTDVADELYGAAISMNDQRTGLGYPHGMCLDGLRTSR
jgi:hypothetical protein